MTFAEGIPSAQVEREWDTVSDLIAKALAESDDWYTPESVKDACAKAAMQLWRVVDEGQILAACVTELCNYPAGQRVCWLFALSGKDFDTWSHHLAVIEAWARAQGCTSLAIQGRKGWVRKLVGWRELAVVLEKAL